MTKPSEPRVPADSLEVRERLIEALKLDLVGPWAGHALAEERLRGWERPSNWYLTGFLIPAGSAPEKRADSDEDDDLGAVPELEGLAEESNEERKAAKKAFFPSSMGLSFLVPKASKTLSVTVRWGDYAPMEVEGPDGNPISVWQRTPREVTCLDSPCREQPSPLSMKCPTRVACDSTSSSAWSLPRIWRHTSRQAPDPSLSSLRTIAAPSRRLRGSLIWPTSSNRNSKCRANSPSCLDPTCVARGLRTGMSKSPICITPTLLNMPRAMASP